MIHNIKKISEITSKLKNEKKYLSGCIVLSVLIACTIIYLVITNIKWILLGVIVWVIIYYGRRFYIDWKNNRLNKHYYDDFEEIK